MEDPVPSIKPSQDIQPLSAFRANAAGFLDQVRATKRPLVLTQHGKSAAVLLDVNEYDAMVDELEFVRDIGHACVSEVLSQAIDGHEIVRRGVRQFVSLKFAPIGCQ